MSWLRFSQRRPWLVLAGCAAVAAIALFFVRRLELHTDMAELLPADHPAVAAMKSLSDHQRLGQSLVVVVESPDRDADLRFLDAIKPRLAASKAFAEIDWGPDRELAAWKQHWRWMYADHATLEQAERLLDSASLEQLKLLVPADKPSSDYYEATTYGTHRVAIMLWRPPHGLGGAGDHAALREVRAAIDELGPTKFHPQMKVELGGHLAQTIEDQDSIRDDLTFATALCTALIFGVIFLYFRRFTMVFVVGVPAVLGVLVALAIASVTLHALNMNTAFLIAIILGNGINSPIVLLARYSEERVRGKSIHDALAVAVPETARSTLAAMAAASVAYGCLAITDFRGFSQFGLLGGVGMLLVWILTFVVVPALVHIVDRSPRRIRGAARAGEAGACDRGKPRAAGWPRLFGALGRGVTRRPRAVLEIALLLGALAIIPIVKLARDPIEWNLRELRTPETTAREVWSKIEALGMTNPDAGYVGSHGALLVDTPDQADTVAEALRAHDRELGDPVFSKVRTFHSLLPADQEAKLAALARIRDAIDRRADRAELLAYRPPDDLRVMTTDDLPAIARRAFTERDGTVGRLVLTSVDSTKYSDWNGRDLIRLDRHLQVDALGKHWTAASPPTVFAGMLETLVRDGPRIALLAAAGVLLLVLLVLGIRDAWSALATQLLALAWFLGIVGALGLKINFFNFVALPITLGVGADYAANLASRLRRDPDGAMAGTGAAVALCSLTTIIGYSSLLSSSNPALKSFGVLADIGEITCLVAALVFLPALRFAGDRGRANRRPL